MTQRLAVELGPKGVRVVCLRPHAIADAPSKSSYTGELFERWAAAAGVNVGQMLGQWAENPTLAQVRPGVTRCVRFASNGTLVLW
jgi:NAD(P)-dependent dehydrogenase (short-subunit alcohol dehydrogenase family)